LLKPNFLRRQYVVNKKFQHYFIAYLFIICVGTLLINILFNQIFLDSLYHNLLVAGVDPGLLQMSRANLSGLFIKFGSIMAASIILICGLGGLLLSNRIAGPLFRALRILDQLSQGESVSVPIRLRARDCFPELETALNKLVNRLQTEKKP
jgi:hypothetical protein